jgi:hypothetical protein
MFLKENAGFQNFQHHPTFCTVSYGFCTPFVIVVSIAVMQKQNKKTAVIP